MDNYERSREQAQALFLEWDQQRMIGRCRLRSDEDFLYLNFLTRQFRIERSTGRTLNQSACRMADYSEALTIYDYLCRSEPLPQPTGLRCPVQGLRHAGQTSPSAVSLHQKYADFFQAHFDSLRAVLNSVQLAPFAQGDAACIFPVFDSLSAVFQFWSGDEEFPPSVRFLWDECTSEILRFETVYYVMGCFLRLLREEIVEFEKNNC